jgi:UDP-glucose 4-epimerase
MTILISGACGFVGSHLARSLVESCESSAVVGLDSLARPGSETNRLALKRLGVQLFHGDVRLASDVEALPSTDWVIDAWSSWQPSAMTAWSIEQPSSRDAGRKRGRVNTGRRGS